MTSAKKPKKDINFLYLIALLVAVIVSVSFSGGVLFKINKNTNKQGNVLAVENNKVVLPGEFPTNFPIYPEMELVNSFTERGDGLISVSVFWKTNASFGNVAAFYKTAFGKEGWKITREFEADNSYTFTVSNSNLDGFVGITKGEDEKMIVSVTLGVNK